MNNCIGKSSNSKSKVSCTLCDKTYESSSGLAYHMLIHTNSYPFPCNFCSKAYRGSSHLAAHVKLKHRKSIVKRKDPLKMER